MGHGCARNAETSSGRPLAGRPRARLIEFLAARLARYELVPHSEAFTAQQQAALAHVSGWSWAKGVVAKKEADHAKPRRKGRVAHRKQIGVARLDAPQARPPR